MKILLIANKVPYPPKDGGAIATLNLARGLSAAGNEVAVLAMNTLKHHIDPEEIPLSLRQMVRFRLVAVPAPISPAGALANLLFSRQPYNAVRFISKVFKNELIRLLQETDFDVVQLEGLYLCPYIPVIRSHSRALISYRAHNIEHEIWARTASQMRGLKRWYVGNLAARIRRFEQYWINRYDLLVPITHRDAGQLGLMGNSRPVQVTPAGIDTETLTPDKTNLEFPSVFHIGSLEWGPNQEGLVWFLKNCWPRLSQKYPGLRFYVAGRNAPAWLVRKMELPGVVFLGEVDDAQCFMNSRAIMVVPLFSGSGMRVKIIEGMSLEKTIVSTPVGAEGLEVDHGRQLLIASREEEFVTAVEELVENRTLFDEIGQEAGRFVLENFDNLALAGSLTAFYQKHLQ